MNLSHNQKFVKKTLFCVVFSNNIDNGKFGEKFSLLQIK